MLPVLHWTSLQHTHTQNPTSQLVKMLVSKVRSMAHGDFTIECEFVTHGITFFAVSDCVKNNG